MENVHLVAEEEEDLYSGYNDYNPTFDSEVSALHATSLHIAVHVISVFF